MNLLYSKQLEVKYSADIIVIGGGPAGIAAAVTASRSGKSVILVEQTGSFGGAGVIAGVPELMNFDDGKNFICKGIGEEIFEKLALKCTYTREWYPIKTEKLKRIYDDMLLSSGVKVLLYTKLVDAIVDEFTISEVVLSGVEGLYAAHAKCFIDSSGNGTLAELAGASYQHGDENGKTMSATLCSLWGGIDFSRKGHDIVGYAKAYADGVFSQYDTALSGIKKNYPEIGVGGGNIGHCFDVNDLNTESLTNATISGRKILSEYEVYYSNYVKGCENAQLIKSADYIGIRESRRIDCLYTLNKDDFYKKEAFFDQIGRYSYPIDIHPMTGDKEGMENFVKSVSMKHENGDSYSIPYRCLVPENHKNLLVAGKIIGADRYMQASARVIPCCYITGQAAGAASAICCDEGSDTADINIKKLQEMLPGCDC